MLEKWIDEEIQYVEKTQQLKLHLPIQPTTTEKQPSEEGVLTTLSVAELAYFQRTLEDTDILKIKNHKTFFRTISQTYRTQNSENISPDSFRNKFYNPEAGVKASLKKKLIDILNYINKDDKN